MPEFSDSIGRIQSIRQQLVVSRFKNIAFADFSISDDVDFLIAISGKSTRPGTVGKPISPIFKTFEVPPGHKRDYDSEYLILEELAYRYRQTPEISGTVYLFTERPPCASCSFVIEQFKQRFPNIKLTVNHININISQRNQ